MNYNYCQFCFKKTPLTTDIAKFCTHCGKPFIEVNSTSTNTPKHSVSSDIEYRKKIIQLAEQRYDDEIETDSSDDFGDNEDSQVNKLPKIDELDIEIELAEQTGTQVRNLARNNPAKKKKEKVKQKPKTKREKEEFLKRFQKEASAIRK